MPKTTQQVECSYQQSRGRYYNAQGFLPCGECPGCRAQAEALARLKKWNADTEAGASPTR